MAYAIMLHLSQTEPTLGGFGGLPIRRREATFQGFSRATTDRSAVALTPEEKSICFVLFDSERVPGRCPAIVGKGSE